MATPGTLHDAFIDELRDAYDGERQLVKALAKLAKAATAPNLSQAFSSHRTETERQIERLETVFQSLGERVRGKYCEGIAGIVEEGASIMDEDFDEEAMDACLIAAGQRAEHYEIAAYGTLVAWATAMGHKEVASLLQETLDEERAADKKLSNLAEGGINQVAADAAHADDENDHENVEKSTVSKVMNTAKKAVKRALKLVPRESTRVIDGPETSMAKKLVRKRSSTKRELIDTGTDKRYVKRASRGQFKESDDVSRSLSADRRRSAKKAVPSGYGDQGDRPQKRTAKKR